jgi:hypothetical protein
VKGLFTKDLKGGNYAMTGCKKTDKAESLVGI